jgi:hypothetical protein
MKTSFLTNVLISLLGSFATAQPIPPDSLYLGQIPPGNTPQIFNLSVNTGSFAAERIAISDDNKEIYYTELHNYYPAAGDTIMCYKYTGNHWTGPENLFNGYLAPAFSVSSDTMYFQNDTIQNNSIVYQTFFSARNDLGWANPQRLLANLNSAHYLQVTNNGHYYISSISNPSIGAADWCRLFLNVTDTTAVSLGLPLNSAGDNLDFFVSRDESFIIVVKPIGNSTKLCISYPKNDGSWTNPKSLGSQINFGLGSWGPYVSSDNKYLFYTTGILPDYSDTYVYWVRIDSLIDSLMQTNYVPYLKNQIPQQNEFRGESFTFATPDSTFIDDDGNNTLIYHANLTNGSPLPSWLTFDTVSATFTGTPDIIQTLNIRVKATDNAGAYAATTFKIIVEEPTSINQIKGQGVRIWPNPTNGLFNISLDPVSDETNRVEIQNIEGKVIFENAIKRNCSIDLTDIPKGIYILNLFYDSEIIHRKVCIE